MTFYCYFWKKFKIINKMKKSVFYLMTILMLMMSLTFVSCEKEVTTPVETNPFLGSWRDTAYDNGSYEQYTFNADMSFTYFFYEGTDGSSETTTGVYDYSETTSIITVSANGESDAASYNFVDASTLVMDGYTYFKQ